MPPVAAPARRRGARRAGGRGRRRADDPSSIELGHGPRDRASAPSLGEISGAKFAGAIALRTATTKRSRGSRKKAIGGGRKTKQRVECLHFDSYLAAPRSSVEVGRALRPCKTVINGFTWRIRNDEVFLNLGTWTMDRFEIIVELNRD